LKNFYTFKINNNSIWKINHICDLNWNKVCDSLFIIYCNLKGKITCFHKTICSFSQIFCWNRWILITTSNDSITYFYCIIVLQIVHSTYHYLNTKDPMVFIFLLTHVFKLLCYVYIGNMIFVTTFKIDYFSFILPCLQL